MADCRHHSPHLAVFAFVDDQLNIGTVSRGKLPNEVGPLGGGGLARLDIDALAKPLKLSFRRRSAHRRQVGFGDMVAWVGHAIDEIAVIGKKDQAFGIYVKPPDRTQEQAAREVHKLADNMVRMRIGDRACVTARLVQDNVVMPLLSGWQRTAVDRDPLRRGIGPSAQFGDHDAVHTDASRDDPLFRRSA